MQINSLDSIQQFDVIIIGAGISGLAAARKLIQINSKLQKFQKISYVVLEAQDHFGGRIQKIVLSGVEIDIGAYELPYFNPQNFLVAKILQKKWPLKYLTQQRNKVYYYDENGKEFDNKQMQKIQKLLQKFLKKMKQQSLIGQIQENYPKFIHKLIQQAQKQLSSVSEKRLFDLLLSLMEQQEAQNIENLSWLIGGFEDQQEQLADYYPLPGDTFHGIVRRLAEGQNQKEKVHIKFNVVAIMIDYSLMESQNEFSIIIQCKQKEQIVNYRCKKVVCSVPLSQLKLQRIKFHPKLPGSYQKTIDNLNFGNMDKIIIQLQQSFWPSDALHFKVANKQKGRYPHFLNLSQNGKHILVCFITDLFNHKILSLSDAQIIADVKLFLQSVFHKQITIRSFYITRWSNIPFIQGSYTSFGPKFTLHDIQNFIKPVDNKIWFVGEHCYRKNIGCAHGAYQTAINAINDLYTLMKRDN